MTRSKMPRARALLAGAVTFAVSVIAMSGVLSVGRALPGGSPLQSRLAWGEASAPTELDQEAKALFRTTMSPFCPGRTIDDCPSPYAGEWRNDIRTWLKEGVSIEEIRKRLRERAQHDLTGTPNTALDAVLPISVTLASMLLLGILLRLLLRPAAPLRADTSTPSSRKLDEKELDQRLDDELQNLED